MMGENPGTFSGARENGEGSRLAKAETRRLAFVCMLSQGFANYSCLLICHQTFWDSRHLHVSCTTPASPCLCGHFSGSSACGLFGCDLRMPVFLACVFYEMGSCWHFLGFPTTLGQRCHLYSRVPWSCPLNHNSDAHRWLASHSHVSLLLSYAGGRTSWWVPPTTLIRRKR